MAREMNVVAVCKKNNREKKSMKKTKIMFTPLISVETHKQTKQTNETKTNKQKKTHTRTHAHISWQGKDAVFGKHV